ncbi:MAG: hypothetical protein PVI23_05925 [Maricaulaceae bacterium]
MRENTPLMQVAFWIVTVLAILWAIGSVAAFAIGLWQATSLIWPILIAVAPGLFIIFALVFDRMRDAEDRRYSRDIHE